MAGPVSLGRAEDASQNSEHQPSDTAVGRVASTVPPWPRPAVARYTLAVLAVVTALSYIDRGVITLLVRPIERDLGLNDTQIGVLIGAAVSSVYLILSLPLSRLSDSKNRKVMISIGVAFWSLATAACGLARSYWQMFLARSATGAGETVFAPAAYSLVADTFPREKLPRAIAILTLGVVFGAGLSLLVGGALIAFLAAQPQIHLPVVGAVRNWQVVFFLVGLPGLAVALLMMSVPEPKRRGLGLGVVARSSAIPVGEVVAHLRRSAAVYGPIFLGIFLFGIQSSGALNWQPAFYERTYGWSPERIGVTAGTVNLIAAPLGLLISVWLTERLSRTHDDANLRVPLIAYAVSLPFMIAAPLMPTAPLALACNAVGGAASQMATPPIMAALQCVTPNRMRAQVSSLFFMMFGGFTTMIGPVFVGAITDYVLRDESRLRYAICASGVVTLPLALLVLRVALKPYRRAITDIKRLEAEGRI